MCGAQRLPNEVKKKLYVSRFQASLKEIMKNHTDGDLFNAFTKHIEVITAALGVTFVEVASLKKLYCRNNRSRHLSPNKALARDVAGVGHGMDGGRDVASGLKTLGVAARARSFASPKEGTKAVAYTAPPSVNQRDPFDMNQWQSEMLRKCDETLAFLQHIQTTANEIR